MRSQSLCGGVMFAYVAVSCRQGIGHAVLAHTYCSYAMYIYTIASHCCIKVAVAMEISATTKATLISCSVNASKQGHSALTALVNKLDLHPVN